MNKKAYIAPAVEIVDVQGEALMAASGLTGKMGDEVVIGYSGEATTGMVVDSKINDLWEEDED